MDFAKIVVKSNYDKRGDLVLRSYVRALKKIGKIGDLFLNNDEALIYGIVDSNGDFRELFTNNVVDYDDHSSLTNSEYDSLSTIIIDFSDEDIARMKEFMEAVLFNENRDLGFQVSTMAELSEDRYIELEAYDEFLSGINPYPRLLPDEDQGYMMAFNNLRYKLDAIKRMNKLNKNSGYDEYDLINYENIGKQRGAYKRK